MDFDRKQYFTELADATVKGFTIIEHSDGDHEPTDDSAPSGPSVRVAEKWKRSHGKKWHAYWIPISKLEERLSEEKVEYVGDLTDDQFDQVCQKVKQPIRA